MSSIYCLGCGPSVRDEVNRVQFNGSEAQLFFCDSVEAIRAHADAAVPTVLLIDSVGAEQVDGSEREELLAEFPNWTVLLLVGPEQQSQMNLWLKSRARQVCQQPVQPDEFRSIIGDLLTTSAELTQHVQRRQAAREVLSSLTQRESQILIGVVDGKANKHIAADLEISQKTVEAHRSRLMKKLNVRSVAALVRVYYDAVATEVTTLA